MSQARVALFDDLVAVRADQRGDGVVDIGDATLRFGRSLVAADGGLARQVARHRAEDRTRRQGGAGRVRPKRRHVERQIHDGLLASSWRQSFWRPWMSRPFAEAGPAPI